MPADHETSFPSSEEITLARQGIIDAVRVSLDTCPCLCEGCHGVEKALATYDDLQRALRPVFREGVNLGPRGRHTETLAWLERMSDDATVMAAPHLWREGQKLIDLYRAEIKEASR